MRNSTIKTTQYDHFDYDSIALFCSCMNMRTILLLAVIGSWTNLCFQNGRQITNIDFLRGQLKGFRTTWTLKLFEIESDVYSSNHQC